MGRHLRLGQAVLLLVGGFALLAWDAGESPATAKFLDNGVRVGDRSSMTVRRRPSSGVRKRIFAPGERRPSAGAGRRGGSRQRHEWFWKLHSTAASAGGPERFAAALATMDKRRREGKPLADMTKLREIATVHAKEIARAARAHKVSEALIIAVISVESRGKIRAVSHKGASGLMQLIPATARRFGVSDPFDPAQNIHGGAAYLNWLLTEFRGDTLLALAGYNAGEGAVRKHNGVPPYNETRDYVVLVMDALAGAQALCPRPLEGPRQPCPPIRIKS